MSETLVTFLLFFGSTFLLLAAIGVNRMPDLYSRIQASAKASTLGAGCMVIALAVYFHDFSVTIRALLVVAFLFLTVPVAGHVIGRSAYFIGIPLSKRLVIDELRRDYDPETHPAERKVGEV